LGDVPYDVFFDDPLAVAAEGRVSAAAKDSAATASPKGSPTVAAAGGAPSSTAGVDADATGTWNRSAPQGAKGTAAAGGAPQKPASSAEWSQLIDVDTLDAEVKHIRTDLTAGMQSVGRYNAHYQEVAVASATLAALAEIVAEDPRSIRWKDNAGIIRDLSANVHDAAKALGGPAYQATKPSSDQLLDVLDGNVPAGLPPSEPRRDFSQVANRGALMKRMEAAFQRLKKEGPAQQSLKKDAGQVLEDASMLAVLGRVIAAGRYDSADDPKYQGHAKELTRAASDMTVAIKAGEAAGFADALTRVQKRCDACHADFRF
jgi:cytochrome c556